MSAVRRVYVKKKRFDAREKELYDEITQFLRIPHVRAVRVFVRYDAEHVPDSVFEEALNGIFAEPPLDTCHIGSFDASPQEGELSYVFSVEALPGQYDQRADSCEQALRLLDNGTQPVVRTAMTYQIIFDAAQGEAAEEAMERIRAFCVNPVDSRIAAEEIPETLQVRYEEPEDVPVLTGFTTLDEAALTELYTSLSLAMTQDDFRFIREHFRDRELRDPTMTEIRVLDTYWSDHCRHTTFSTKINSVSFEEGEMSAPIRAAQEQYLAARKTYYADPVRAKEKGFSLMELATAGMRALKHAGMLNDMEESEENNACTIIVPVEITRETRTETEEWLLFFKNETHNHPTEIEPFGGAATCLGGAIRDPLSGRGYVYQAMRVSGAADPTQPVLAVLPGKLPQKKIVRDAAAGYSSYGNQIGLCTGLVDEIYHPGYVAKRMEIGAVLGAAPRENVRRLSPVPGDVVILVGGRTGRDGIGGATGSSKAHTESSLESCGAEVQKGNALTERKIQRLFRRKEVSFLIKKCNDFGAGGVSVAIGELAEGLRIDLDAVPKKYEGLDGTELAISESQERMAVVIAAEDEKRFLSFCAEENLEAVRVAVVTDSGRMVMMWRGKKIVDIARAFLDTNGAIQETDVRVRCPDEKASVLRQCGSAAVSEALAQDDVRGAWLKNLMDLNVCGKRGLSEMFDASIGAASVMMPFGGKTQMTPVQTMVAAFPVPDGETDDVSMMSYGFDPYVSSWSPFHGAVYAVVQSVAKIVAAGGDIRNLHFTFQEYFGRMNEDPARWGMPYAALLGAFSAQMGFSAASIGGKDSMSGTFRDTDVPPTLVSFAVSTGKASETVTPELKEPGNYLVLFAVERDRYDLPDYSALREMYAQVTEWMRLQKIISCYAVDAYGVAAALSRMSFGNERGFHLDDTLPAEDLFQNGMGHLVAEVKRDAIVNVMRIPGAVKIGTVTKEQSYVFRGTQIFMPEALQCWTSPLEKIFPSATPRVDAQEPVDISDIHPVKTPYICRHRTAVPRVFIPVFPGTNCEYDLQRAFEKAGAGVRTAVFRNRTPADIADSVAEFEREIDGAQILMFPGGFSAGDEPDGSAKFFATVFRNERIREATHRLLDLRDGLALGICNGFQAMIKLGLLPSGHITGQQSTSPTLTYNTIGRHISRMANLRVVQNASPWLMLADTGRTYVSPVSHGEGRFVADSDVLRALYENGQVATVYCDPDGIWDGASSAPWNLNGSDMAIEGILSPDGRCYGKMAHAERTGKHIAKNVPGEQDMHIFEAGVRYFQDT